MKSRQIIPRKLSEFTFYFKEGHVFRLGKTEKPSFWGQGNDFREWRGTWWTEEMVKTGEQLTEAEALIKIK